MAKTKVVSTEVLINLSKYFLPYLIVSDYLYIPAREAREFGYSSDSHIVFVPIPRAASIASYFVSALQPTLILEHTLSIE